MGIGDRIRDRRSALGLTQLQLAQKIDHETDSMSVSRWERGVVVPRPETIVAIADVLGVDVRWLIKGDETESTGTEG